MNVFSWSLSPFLMASSPRLCRLQLPPPDIKEKRSDSESTCGGSSQHRGVTGWWFQPLWKILVKWCQMGVLFPIYIWVWVNTYRYIFSGMNIHLPAILGFTRYQGFDPSPYGTKKMFQTTNQLMWLMDQVPWGPLDSPGASASTRPPEKDEACFSGTCMPFHHGL